MLFLRKFLCDHQSNKNANSSDWRKRGTNVQQLLLLKFSSSEACASRSLRARGGDVDEDIESDEDRDEHVEFEHFLSSLDEQPSDAELDED